LDVAVAETAAWKAVQQQGVRKLRRYWRRLGSVPLAPTSEYLLLDLEKRQPPARADHQLGASPAEVKRCAMS
jgi:hypothetical protein